MAEEQIKTNVTIGVNVEGGDSAAQRLNKLALELGALDRTASAMRGLANLPIQFRDLITSSYKSAKGLESTKDQAAALSPAIKQIGDAVRDLKLPNDVLKSAGLDDASLKRAGRNAGNFRELIENLARTRGRAIEQSAAATGKAEQLRAEMGLNRTAAAREEIAAAKAFETAENRQKFLSRLVGDMRQLNAQWSRGFEKLGPSLAELRAAKIPAPAAIPPIRAQALLGQGPLIGTARRPTATGTYTSATDRATQALGRETSAATAAAGAMRDLAGAKQQVASGEQRVATATGNLIQQLMREIKTAPQAGAALHKMMRQTEAQFNQAYAQRSVGTFGAFAGAVRGATTAVRANGDALLSQVKQVAVLATTFSVLQGVAGRLQEGFSHLTGGIIGFNQMLERTTVGFRVLFENQEQQIQRLREMGDEAKQLDYIAMGYDNAGAAAEGMVETIRQFANVTPFRFEELAESTLRMRAFGFSMDEVLYKSEDVKGGFDGAVVAIGDAVAALGGGAERFRRITYALGQMKQAGRVYQNDMMQLANAGIGGYQYIANALRKEITEGNTGRKEDVKSGYAELYDELSKNTIETVRRLTTNGQISGEAASRAIIDGLKEDFGGGMAEFSKTFVGAWTTLADTSQSLVATAFKPFYDELRDVLYDLAQFFQTPEADALAKSFQPTIQKLTKQVFGFVRTSGQIFMLFVKDITGAFNAVKGEANRFGLDFKTVFDSLRSGIGVVVDLLKNDMTRGLIGTSVAFTALAQFAMKNPMLTAIIAIIGVLGLLKRAYEQNTAGFRNTIDGLAKNFLGLIKVIQENLIPAVTEFTIALGSTVFIVALELFKSMAVVLEAVAAALATILQFLRPIAPIFGAIVAALGLKFVWALAVKGIKNIVDNVVLATNKLREMGTQAQKTGSTVERAFGFNTTTRGGRNKKGGIGLGGLTSVGFGAGIGADMLGAPDIGGVIFQLTLLASLFANIKTSLPPATINRISGAFNKFGGYIRGLSGMGRVASFFGRIAASIGSLTAVVSGGAVVAAVVTVVSTIIGLIAAILNFGKGMPTPGKGSYAYNYLTGGQQSGGTTGGYLGSQADPTAKGKPAPVQRPITIYDIQRDNALAAAEEERNERMAKYESFRDGSAAAAAEEFIEQQKTTKEYNLLVGEQKKSEAAAERRNKLQEKYNRLLAQAQQKLEYSNSVLQDLASATLQKLLDTNIARVNPYTGLIDEALKLDDVLRIQQEMLFTNFETVTGTSKSFEEYADILNSIVPLQEKDRTEGKLNLAAVRERLKIEKERRRELDLIRENAEAEYDLGLATLQQYDESVDPLQRAVNLRKAQAQYETSIRDSQMSGLELALDQALGSNQWAVAQNQIEQKLSDIDAGQGLILGEMERRFEVYNERVAAIMANPDFSAEKRKEELQKALDSLIADLETNFGVTKEAMNEQFDLLNTQIGLARGATDASFAGFLEGITNPTIPPITWAQSLGISLNDAFTGIYNSMVDHFNKISDIAKKISDVATGGGGGGSPTNKKTVEDVIANRLPKLQARLSAVNSTTFWKGFSGDSTKERKSKAAAFIANIESRLGRLSDAKTVEEAQQIADNISASLSSKGLRRGGMAMGGNPYLVGEGGPELFLPRSSGLVLNNSVSSRLMSMLTGRPSQSASNVTINVNNPVIRNENDIRKLALEISRVQASQFRTEGGRL